MKRDIPHFRIGLLLTEAGILAPEQLDEAIRQGEQTGEPFLKVLVSSGGLRQHELQAVIRAQSLIWGGILDVERAIGVLRVVHAENVSFDDGLRSVGWIRPEGLSLETLQAPARGLTASLYPEGSALRTNCQYCGTKLDPGAVLCSFCTGDNSRTSVKLKSRRSMSSDSGQISARPSRVVDSLRIRPAAVPRDPLLMAFFSGLCLPGAGQMLIGQLAKGICLALIFFLTALMSGGISSLLILPAASLDAYLLAEKLRRGKSVGPWEFF